MFLLTRRLLIGFCVAALGGVSPGALAQELDILNADFELFPEDETPFNWQFFVTPAQATGQSFTTVAGTVDDPAPQGDYYARIENNYQLGGAAVVKQPNQGIGIVEPGQPVKVSFWARADWGDGGVQFAELFSEKDGGGTSKAEILSGGPLFNPGGSAPVDWTFFQFVSTLGPDVVGGVTVQFSAATGAVPGGFSILDVDDLKVEVFDGLPGDYNSDNVVDAADYAVYRNNLGLDSSALNGNGSGSPTVVPADYDLWRSQYGQGLSSTAASVTAAPEPLSASLLAMLLALAGVRRMSVVRAG